MSRFFFNIAIIYTQSGNFAMFKLIVWFISKETRYLPFFNLTDPQTGFLWNNNCGLDEHRLLANILAQSFLKSDHYHTSLLSATVVYNSFTCRWSAMCHCFTPGCVSEEIDHDNRITTTNFEGSNWAVKTSRDRREQTERLFLTIS